MVFRQLTIFDALDLRTTRDDVWTDEEIERLKSLYAHHTQAELARLLGRSVPAVRTRCSIIGLRHKSPPWTEEEVAALRAAYSKGRTHPVDLGELAARLGRHKSNICRKARGLGLTLPSRRKKRLISLPMAGRTEQEFQEYRRKTGDRIRALWESRGHPRGMLGKHHTDETKRKIGVHFKAMWGDASSAVNSPEYREKIAERMRLRHAQGEFVSSNTFSRCRRGFREDLQLYVRSSWEANYARYLNTLVASGVVTRWEYESRVFVFPSPVTGGVSSYRPDFLVFFSDGRVEWHEVKGWMTSNGKIALELMATHYPSETVKVIGGDWFREAQRGTISKSVPNWE